MTFCLLQHLIGVPFLLSFTKSLIEQKYEQLQRHNTQFTLSWMVSESCTCSYTTSSEVTMNEAVAWSRQWIKLNVVGLRIPNILKIFPRGPLLSLNFKQPLQGKLQKKTLYRAFYHHNHIRRLLSKTRCISQEMSVSGTFDELEPLFTLVDNHTIHGFT